MRRFIAHPPRRRWRGLLLGAAAMMAVSTGARAFPWDIDMVDAYFLRAYEWAMMAPPEGAVSRNMYTENFNRDTPEGQALQNPLQPTPEVLASGQKMFTVYCQTCHGVDGKGGAEVMRNDPSLKIFRFPVAAPMLSGPGSVSSGRSDGYIYLTIRNGGAVMPSYKQAMTNNEMWATVAYLRTLEGAQYAPAAPATPAAPEGTPATPPEGTPAPAEGQ